MKNNLILILSIVIQFSLYGQTNQYPLTGSVTIFDYSPALVLQRNTIAGGFIQGIQTRFTDGSDNWYFGTLHTDRWIVAKGNYLNPKFTVLENGNVGIGTIDPQYPLDINYISSRIIANDFNGVTLERLAYPNQGALIFSSDRTGYTFHIGNRRVADGTYLPIISMYDHGNVGIGTVTPAAKLDVNGDIFLKGKKCLASDGTSTFLQSLTHLYFETAGASRMILTNDGKLGIGTLSPGDFKLNVKGKIRADEIIVNSEGADFVFHPSYNLPDLGELELYIRNNNHLPGFDPASVMQENGMSIGEMQTKLLQKVEELTLYIIHQEKKMKILEQRIEEEFRSERK